MDYKDYFNWADEYRKQEQILDDMLKKRKNKCKGLTYEQQKAFDYTTRMIYGMKLDCANTASILGYKAKVIKERANEE